MAVYTIRPVKVGSLLYYRGAFTSDPDQYVQREEFPILMFLIQGQGRNILVDTGGGDPAHPAMIACAHTTNFRTPEQVPDAALRALGLSPEDIDTVILSHLHWDHCYNNHLFPNADFYVQKAELQEAAAPHPAFEKIYEAFSQGVVPPWARQASRWKVVEGDCDLCEGIRLLLMPGHSPGLQGVLVDTEQGQYLLPSDAVPLYDCIAGLAEGKYNVSSLSSDPAAFLQTFHRMRELHLQGVTILASHDGLTLKQEIYPQL